LYVVREIFGTFNATTATNDEKTLSKTIQTIWANFIKDPTASPAQGWQRWVPGNNTATLARLAFNGNVELGNVVESVSEGFLDVPCDEIWNKLGI